MIKPWSWQKSNGTATDEETKMSYKAITTQGLTVEFSANVWNDLIYKTTEVLQAFQRTWDDSYRSLNDTLMIHYEPTGDLYTHLNYKSFNALVYNLHYPYWSWELNENAIGYLGRRKVWAGVYIVGYDHSDIVYGSYFLEIAKNLNVIIGILNDTVNKNDISLNINITNSIQTLMNSLQSKAIIGNQQLYIKNTSILGTSELLSNKIHHNCSSPIFKAELETEQGFEYATGELRLNVKQLEKLLSVTNYLLSIVISKDINLLTQANIYQSRTEKLNINYQDYIYFNSNMILQPSCSIQSRNTQNILSNARIQKSQSNTFSWNGIDTQVNFKAIMDTALGKGSIIDILAVPNIDSLFTANMVNSKTIALVLSHELNSLFIPNMEIATPTVFFVNHTETANHISNLLTRKSNVAKIKLTQDTSILSDLSETKTHQLSHLCPLKLVAVPNAEVGRHSSIFGKAKLPHYYVSRMTQAKKELLNTSVSVFSYEFKATVEQQELQGFTATNIASQDSFSSLEFLQKTLKTGATNSFNLCLNASAELIRYCYLQARTEIDVLSKSLLAIDSLWEYPIQIGTDLYISQEYETVKYLDKVLINPESMMNKLKAITLISSNAHTSQNIKIKASHDSYISENSTLSTTFITAWEMPIQTENNLKLTQLKNNIHTDKKLEVV